MIVLSGGLKRFYKPPREPMRVRALLVHFSERARRVLIGISTKDSLSANNPVKSRC
jgi:hypothetical protein